MSGIAIAAEGVWKSYRIYHQRSHTLKEKVLSRRNIYEHFWALRGIDLEIAAGSTTGIIGANGSGKSTLLKTFAGILSPNKGSVRTEGVISPLLELGTGFHPELTGGENIYLAGSLLGQSRRDIKARFDEIVDFAGVEKFIDAPVKNYSSGMYARLAFAVAISVEPDILIIDEVLAVGDESFQMKCHQRMAEFRAQGRTVVLVSHSSDAIRSLCSHAAWLSDGVVREAGRAHDVVASYLADVHGDPDHAPALQIEGIPSPGTRSGSGEVAITEVSFIDQNGISSGNFRTNEPLTLVIRYRATGTVGNISCGVGVFSSVNLSYLFGVSTAAAGIDVLAHGEGCVELTIPELPLLRGNYLVTIALVSTETAQAFDVHDRRYSFFVFENPDMPPTAGMVHVPTTWKVTSSTVAA
jgi:ABC-2 type transport system ATP-binding protein